MTIDEAIEHATKVADSYKDTAPDCDCARDHRQLAEWLKKVRVYEKVKKRSVSMIRKLKEENAKLSTQLTDVTESMGRVEERCAKLREELKDQEGYDQMLRDRLRQQTELCVKAKAENAMLRERLLESREANEHLSTELRRYKSIFRMKPRAMNALFDENSKLRKLTSSMYKDMQGVLLLATDTVFVNCLMTLRECMDEHMESMAELGMPPSDYESRMRELRSEVV